MGDNSRMSRSMYVASSARKGNTEEVAKRRAAMRFEIELRQKAARKLLDEKMMRAAAQKEEIIAKNREAQKREKQRIQMVLDRRAQVFAEEKMRKSMVLPRADVISSHASANDKSRPQYAFGSSTPRELGHLTQLTKEQKVYDRKLTPTFDQNSVNGSPNLTLSTPPSRNQTPTSAMTRSMYVVRSEPRVRTRQAVTSSPMSQLILCTPRVVNKRLSHMPTTTRKSVLPNQSVNARTDLRPPTGKRSPPMTPTIHRTAMKQAAAKSKDMTTPKPVPRKIVKKKDDNSKQEVVEGQTINTHENTKSMSEPLMISSNENVHADIVNDRKAIDDTENGCGHLLVILDREEKITVKVESADDLLDMREIIEELVDRAAAQEDVKVQNQINTQYSLIAQAIEAADKSKGKNEGADKKIDELIHVESVIATEAFSQAASELHETVDIVKLTQAGDENAIADFEKNDLLMDEHEAKSSGEQNVMVEEKDEERSKQPLQTEEAKESAAVVDERNSSDEEGRRQIGKRAEDVVEREQKEKHERELRKAKLASIMSRTRGGMPPTAIVNPTTKPPPPPSVNSATTPHEAIKSGSCTTSPTDATTPVKGVLSQTTASVLQKLASTNPKLLSVLRRNGSNPSLADELAAVDPMLTLPGQPIESSTPVAAHQGSSSNVLYGLTFEPDVNHRPVAS